MNNAKITEIIDKISKNAPIFIALLITFSAIIYYFYALTTAGVILSIILSIISLIILNKAKLLNISSVEKLELNIPLINTKPFKLGLESPVIIIYSLFFIMAITTLILARSEQAFISPWEIISKRFFVFYFFSSLTLIIAISRKHLNKIIKLILISLHYFLSLSIAIIIYKIGYGFDPFIHQAAMEIIDQTGVILPKTPYYIGQYGLIISLHKLLGISIYLLNKLLVPIIAALLLPTMTYKLLSVINKKESSILPFLTTIFILAFSLPLFIISTPQNLSYIFIIISLIVGLTDKTPTRAIIFSVATLAIHPLSGIPAIIWSLWLIMQYYQAKLTLKIKKIITGLIFLSGAIVLPLALFLISGGELNNIQLNLTVIGNQIKEIFIFSAAGSENWLLNLTYFIFYNTKLLILALIIVGIILFYQKYQKRLSEDKISVWKGLIIISASLIIAFILSAQISFKQLITYEQADYVKRLVTIVVIFLMPFAALTTNELIKKISAEKKVVKLIWLMLGITYLTASLYLAYPRFDRYFNSRGYNTSSLDLEAVEKIAKQTTQKYIVLANQPVSLAALKTFGFDNYLPSPQGLIYFYPIPTGGPLYRYYLDMVYKNPDRETMLKAMNLVGVNEAYLIVNKYWNESGKIIESAKLTADNWEELGEKEIFIFKYKR